MPVNPLAAYFPVQERSDGLYITVSREKRDNLQIDDVLRAVAEAEVINFNKDAFDEVVRRARGVPERIGPLFEYYDRRVEKFFHLSITDMKATLRISSQCVAEGVAVSYAMVMYFLQKRKGLCHGLKSHLIEQAVAEAKYDTDLVVARGTPPVHGTDARICFEIDLHPAGTPHIRSNGTVDYKDIQTFALVAKDQVIARKILPDSGRCGMSVRGIEIPSVPGKDVAFPAGANTTVSADGQFLLAARSGVVRREGALVSVCGVLTIERDVDYSVGNIKFAGELVIKGDVKA